MTEHNNTTRSSSSAVVTPERSRPTVCGCAPTSTSLWSIPRPKFVERIRLHQFVAGTGDATVDYGTLLGEGIRLVVDSATRIDTAARTVQLASGRALDYDYVIYAVGSTGSDTVIGAWRGRIRLSHR